MATGRIKALVFGRLSKRRLLVDLVLIPLLIYLAVALYAWLGSDRLIFQPQPPSYTDLPCGLTLNTADNVSLAGVFMPNPDAAYTILYSHGNAEDLGDILPRLKHLVNLGFAVFAYDYRGYGRSEGNASTQGAMIDMRAAFDYVTGTLGIPGESIILYGRSVGTGPATWLAAQTRVAGLILQSPFRSTFTVMTRVRILPFDKFDNSRIIARINCPLLVMHGRRDGVIPFEHGQRLYEKATEPKQHLWLPEAGHNRFPGDYDREYDEALRTFSRTVADTRQRELDRTDRPAPR